MTTSGTVGQTRATITDLIEHATRRCGVLPSMLSGEQQLAARKNLFFLCTDLVNRGLSLFSVKQVVLGMLTDQTVFNLPASCTDVLDVLYRTKTDLDGDGISGSGYEGLDLGTGNEAQATNVGFRVVAAATLTPVLEGSADGATWVQYGEPYPETQAVGAGAWCSFDAPNAPPLQLWRLRNTAGALPTLAELTFSNQPYEINMAPLNRDDYVMFPNKQFNAGAGSKSLQYWFNKQIAPSLRVWPATEGTADQIVVWYQTLIEDPGSFKNELAVPQRWYESIIFSLATRIAVELPADKLPPGRLEYLETKAEQHLTRAENGESDGSAIRIAPNLRGYSR